MLQDIRKKRLSHHTQLKLRCSYRRFSEEGIERTTHLKKHTLEREINWNSIKLIKIKTNQCIIIKKQNSVSVQRQKGEYIKLNERNKTAVEKINQSKHRKTRLFHLSLTKQMY